MTPVVKSPLANAGDVGSIPGWGKSPGVRNGNPFQCSCMGNSMHRGTWQATVHRIAKSWASLSIHIQENNAKKIQPLV